MDIFGGTYYNSISRCRQGYRLPTVWGAAGVTLAILYMLSGFQALASIVVGLLVIAAVAYITWRMNKSASQAGDSDKNKSKKRGA